MTSWLRLPSGNVANAFERYAPFCGLRLAEASFCSSSSARTLTPRAALAVKVTLPADAVAVTVTLGVANGVAGGVDGAVPVGLTCRYLVASAMYALMPSLNRLPPVIGSRSIEVAA